MQPQTSKVGESIKTSIQKLEPENSLVRPLLGNDFDRQAESNVAGQGSTTNDHLILPGKCNLDNPSKTIGKAIQSPMTKFITPEKNLPNRNPESNSTVSSTTPQTSTPISKKKSSSSKKRAKIITCDPSENHDFNPHFKNSVEYEHFTGQRDGRNLSFDDNSFPSLGGRNSNSLNCSRTFGKDESSDLNLSNFSVKSLNNKILQSPVSPLYSNSASMLSPINSKVYQNRILNSPSNDNVNQLTNTPPKMSNSIPKNSKTTPRQNFSLSDFITTDTQSSKKSSTKKVQSKLWSKSEEQNDDDACNVIPNKSTEHSENKSKKSRKVNPTRISNVDKKGNTHFKHYSTS